jgi:hypothetical protein
VLKCRYRFIAKQNQYIKLTIEQIDFDMDEAENVYFTSFHNESVRANRDKCLNMSKRVVFKELNSPWTNTVDSELFYDPFEATQNNNDNFNFDEASEEEDVLKKSQQLRLCLCKMNKYLKYVYISKYDAIEVEYEVRLDQSEDLMRLKNSFAIKYEFKNRNCDKFLSSKSEFKGKLAYTHSMDGFQGELFDYLNDTIKSNYHGLYSNEEDKLIKEREALRYILSHNLNFHCKFNIIAPKNNYIHIEFFDLHMANGCDHNHIKLYSNFSKANKSLEMDEYFMNRPVPFIRLCSSPVNLNKYDKAPDLKEQSMVVAEFFDESVAKSSFSCYNSKNKICFMTSELYNDLNPYSKIEIVHNEGDWPYLNFTSDAFEFHNNLVIEILANNLDKFNFEVKYHFYKFDFHVSSTLNDNLRVINNKAQHRDNKSVPFRLNDAESEKLKNSDKYNCDFRCNYDSVNGSLSFKVCIDESLVCDNEVDCIFSGYDELNCNLFLF